MAVGGFNLCNAELSPKRYRRGSRPQEMRKRGIQLCAYTYRYTVTTRMTCIKVGSDERHFDASFIVKDKVTGQCPQTMTNLFEEKGEPKRRESRREGRTEEKGEPKRRESRSEGRAEEKGEPKRRESRREGRAEAESNHGPFTYRWAKSADTKRRGHDLRQQPFLSCGKF